MPSLNESLDSRMKRYEKVAAQQFDPRNTIIVRVDGVAFHTYTKGAIKPFDSQVTEAMERATSKVFESVQGCVLAYTQSDEATFLLTDLQGPNTEGWFGFKKSKIESVIASMFTYYFNTFINSPYPYNPKPSGGENAAFFDARAFSVPLGDVPNVFVWRQRDTYKNFINSVARYTFGHKSVQGKSNKELATMLKDSLRLYPELVYGANNAFGTIYSAQGAYQSMLGYEGFRSLIELA